MPKIIVIEGGISAGKTTLIKEIEKYLPKDKVIIFTEPHEDTNPYLAHFYKDPAKYIVKLQHWFMSYRLQNYAKVITECDENTIVIMDRCIWSDFVFVKNALKTGIMTERQFNNFVATREDVLEDMPLPNLILHLDVTPEVCYDRIHNMRQIGCESSITLEYLQGLEECYQEYLKNMEENGVKIVRLDWTTFGKSLSSQDSSTKTQPVEHVSNVIFNSVKSPSIKV